VRIAPATTMLPAVVAIYANYMLCHLVGRTEVSNNFFVWKLGADPLVDAVKRNCEKEAVVATLPARAMRDHIFRSLAHSPTAKWMANRCIVHAFYAKAENYRQFSTRPNRDEEFCSRQREQEK